MATIKNITAVDLIEESSGEENLVSEVNGTLKRLPVSQVKGSGGGGGGAGFDIIAHATPSFIPTSGELVIMQPIEITVSGDNPPTFEECFGSSASLNQANIYQREVTVTNYSQTGILYGFYSTSNSEWTYEASIEELVKLELGTMGYSLNVITNSTFAELKALRTERPLSLLVELQEEHDGFRMGMYQNYIADYTDIKPMVIAELSELLPAEVLEADDLLIYMLGTGDEPNGLFVLYEAGTTAEPVLGSCFVTMGS